MSIKAALVSVSDKTGVVEFAKKLEGMDIKIISTGGTLKALKDAGIKAVAVESITGFPEVLDGRVKTLHPHIHAGILAKREKKHLDELKKLKIDTIDLVVVNLYPFEAEASIENIDIGGVTLLRAAAKNHEGVLVVCESDDYDSVIEAIKSNKMNIEFRESLAAKAFRHTAYYDSMISNFFTKVEFPEKITVGLKKLQESRYGENPHQKASIYKVGSNKQKSEDSKQLQGKELSYNNYLDLDSAYNLACEFKDPACVIVKHNNPCGAATDKDILTAYKNALLCDPVSAFGGIVAFNKTVDGKTAEEVIKVFTECVIAPEYSKEALDIFSKKNNLRILIQPLIDPAAKTLEFRSITNGMLVQEKDNKVYETLKVITKTEPTKQEMDSLKFANTVAKCVKSNTITLVRGTQTVGIGAGQMSRIDALKIANIKMQEVKLSTDVEKLPLVMASDAFFPFRDVPDAAAKIGVRAIIQPGGSLKDADSIAACNENNISMVITGTRHFRH